MTQHRVQSPIIKLGRRSTNPVRRAQYQDLIHTCPVMCAQPHKAGEVDGRVGTYAKRYSQSSRCCTEDLAYCDRARKRHGSIVSLADGARHSNL